MKILYVYIFHWEKNNCNIFDNYYNETLFFEKSTAMVMINNYIIIIIRMYVIHHFFVFLQDDKCDKTRKNYFSHRKKKAYISRSKWHYDYTEDKMPNYTMFELSGLQLKNGKNRKIKSTTLRYERNIIYSNTRKSF